MNGTEEKPSKLSKVGPRTSLHIKCTKTEKRWCFCRSGRWRGCDCRPLTGATHFFLPLTGRHCTRNFCNVKQSSKSVCTAPLPPLAMEKLLFSAGCINIPQTLWFIYSRRVGFSLWSDNNHQRKPSENLGPKIVCSAHVRTDPCEPNVLLVSTQWKDWMSVFSSHAGGV